MCVCVCVCVCIHTWVSCCRGNALSFAGWSALGSWLGGATLLGSLNGFDVAQLRRGGMTALEMANMEGLPAAVALAGLLQPSAATLTSVDFRRRHTDKHAHSYTQGACAHVRPRGGVAAARLNRPQVYTPSLHAECMQSFTRLYFSKFLFGSIFVV